MGTFKQMMIGMLPFLMAQKSMEKNESTMPISMGLAYDNLPLRGVWHQSPIYHPQRKKLNGWQKENKRKNYHK